MSVDACAQMVRQADTDRYASAMCAPMPERADLMVLYAFNIEVSRAPWMTQEVMIAEMRLQWWKDAIAEIFEGKTVRNHEVVTPLAELVLRDPGRFPRTLFDELIEARRFDIYREGHGDREAFDAYVQATSGNVMELAGRALGAENISPFQDLGWAMGLANVLAALPDLYELGRDPIPVGEIDRNALIERQVSPEYSRIIKMLAERGLGRIATLGRETVPPKAVPALLAGWNAKQNLRRVQRAPEAVLTTRFETSPLKRTAKLFWYSSGFGRFKG